MSIFINEKRIVPYASGARVTSIEGDDSTLYDMYGTLPTGYTRLKAIRQTSYYNINFPLNGKWLSSRDKFEFHFLPTEDSYNDHPLISFSQYVGQWNTSTSISFKVSSSENYLRFYNYNKYNWQSSSHNNIMTLNFTDYNKLKNTWINIQSFWERDDPENENFPYLMHLKLNESEVTNRGNTYDTSSNEYFNFARTVGLYKDLKIYKLSASIEEVPSFWYIAAFNESTKLPGFYDVMTGSFVGNGNFEPIYY